MLPDHLSWTQEQSYERCAQQYFYRYREGRKLPPGVAIVRGRAPHRSAEADLKAKIERGVLLEREEIAQVATDYVDHAFRGEVLIDGEFEGLTLAQAKQVCREDARLMACRHHDKLAPRISPTAVEVRLRVDLPEFPVPYEGVLDVVDADLAVRDLKTKRKAPGRNDAETSEQLTVYWRLFQVWRGSPPVKLAQDVVWATPGGKVDHDSLWTRRQESDWHVRVRRTERFLEALDREVYLPAPVDAWVCSPRWCGYTGICPYYAGRPRPRS